MTSLLLRSTTAVLTASALLIAVAACAPAVPIGAGNPTNSAGATTAPSVSASATPTSPPVAAVPTQPASRYAPGCGDLLTSAQLSTEFAVGMPAVSPVSFDRENLAAGISDSLYIENQGGLDCLWTDGKAANAIAHEVILSVLPVTPDEWKTAHENAQGEAVTSTTNIYCSTNGSPDGIVNGNACSYLAYANNSRIDLELDGITSNIGSNAKVLPPGVKAIATSIVAAISATPLAPAPAPQVTAATLPAGPAMITPAQIRTALGIPASQKLRVECDGPFDGPWVAWAEARNEVMGGVGCGFGTEEGDSGENYAAYEFLPAGQWAASQLVAATPSEVTVAVPNLPAGDSFTEFTDVSGWTWGELVVGGNLLDFTLTTPFDGLAKPTVPLKTAMINLVQAFETTIRG